MSMSPPPSAPANGPGCAGRTRVPRAGRLTESVSGGSPLAVTGKCISVPTVRRRRRTEVIVGADTVVAAEAAAAAAGLTTSSVKGLVTLPGYCRSRSAPP